MNLNTRKLPRSRGGFTLLEIIIVIALIALIVGAVAPNIGKIFEDNKVNLVPMMIEKIKTPLEAYKLKNGSYPTDEEGLSAVVDAGYLDEIPVDPWKKEFRYRFPGEKNRDSYDIWSLGADGVESDDDIGNWRHK